MRSTAESRRQSIETRLNQRAREERVDANRLRRTLVFERMLVRLEDASPGDWVVKGGMALEWRLGVRARATRDLDLVVRGKKLSGAGLRDELVELLSRDPQGDQFRFEVGKVTSLEAGFRFPVRVSLAAREFASVRVDVAARSDELVATERIALPPVVPSYPLLKQPEIELAAASQHFAEKLHALTRDYGDHPNTRLRDLIDLSILIERNLVPRSEVLLAVQHVFASRATHEVPLELPDPPASWSDGYSDLAVEVGLRDRTIDAAMERLREFWAAVNSSSHPHPG